MQCANYLCIYEKDGGCTLGGISLNIWGSCEECLYINVEEDELKCGARLAEAISAVP